MFARFLTSLLLFLQPLSLIAADGNVQVIIDGKTVTFTDVPQSAWFATYVQQCAESGIVTGYRDRFGKLTGRFGPANNITIAEALKIAVESAGYNEEEYALVINSGVKHWSAPYVAVAKAEGFSVINEYTLLDRQATRAEVAALFTSAFGVTLDLPTGAAYSDVKVGTKFSGSIEALTRDKVLSGDTNAEGSTTGIFRPTEKIKRSEVAKIAIEAQAKYGRPGENKHPSDEVGNTQSEGNIIRYTANGFEPRVLRIKKGQSVSFTNETTQDFWVASDPHPSHTGLPGFNTDRGLGQGDTYMYTFTQIGTWGYHNHKNYEDRGTIVVEE